MITAALATLAFAPLPKLTVKGPDLVDPAGKRVLLKGCNLGNWFVIEPWMLCLSDKFKDQHELEQILTSRFGAEENQRLMDLYRSSWITERDFPSIRSFGMNVVRLPMNYRQFEDDATPFKLRSDAWKWVDKAVYMAEKNGLYTILDMHGVQGGQSAYDHTGRADQNKLWDSPENRKRLAWLWAEIAKRYRTRSAVVAYDVFNEPYGGSKKDQVAVFKQALEAIRKVDPDKMVYAMGNYDDFTHYGSPKPNGWKNVAYQMHYYPGLFGGGDPTVMTHARHLKQLDLIAQQVKEFNAPFLVGEMNVVFKEAGGAGMMRRTFDKHASFGWATTMWSYKALSKEGGIGQASWGMVTNPKPAQIIDFRTASKTEIEEYFRSLATQPYEVYEELRTALTSKRPKLPTLPKLADPISKVPHQDRLAGWTASDIGDSLKGGLKVSNSSFDLYGSGSDIWGRQDQFRYLHHSVSGDFELTATLQSLADVHGYAKAGLMARASLSPSSPCVLLSVFPSGELQLAVRGEEGQEMTGLGKGLKISFPMKLRMTFVKGIVDLHWARPGGDWQKFQTVAVGFTPGYAGVVALSHDNRQLVKASYSDLRLVAVRN
ncbi:MAG: glycoside hydrolase family 5 protein [Fimbriimonas sp.]